VRSGKLNLLHRLTTGPYPPRSGASPQDFRRDGEVARRAASASDGGARVASKAALGSDLRYLCARGSG
jgi:hypothetical protein